MTSFLRPSEVFWAQTLRPNDDSIRQTIDVWTDYKRGPQIDRWADGMLWPSSKMMGGDPSASLYLVGQDANTINRFESMNARDDQSGGQSTLQITGFTRDSAGNLLGSCTVQVFRTSDDLFVSECVSDAGGYFSARSPYVGVAHYLVCYKAGSPDVTGSSVNTLIPS